MGNETVADVVREMAAIPFHSEVYGETVQDFSARIQAAHAREVEALRLRAEAAEAMAGEPGLLRLLVDLRFALGDNGKRMQDELVEYARELAADARRYRWLRNDALWTGAPVGRVEMVWCVEGKNARNCHPIDRIELDEAIDAAIASGGEG